MTRPSLLLSLALAGGIAMTSCAEPKAEKVRKSILAGSWYEGTKAGLTAEVDRYLNNVVPVAVGGRIIGLISPHAGYFYSGQAAAYGYSEVKGGDYDTVIILAPSHRVGFEGISVPDYTHYETPLGRVPIDRRRCDALLAVPGFETIPEADAQEHSVEIQLPFLQRVLRDFRLVPLVVGEVSEDDYPRLSKAIASIVDESSLLIASSDFTHYGSRFGYVPFREDLKENLRKLDMGAVEYILGRDVEGFVRYRDQTGATICGATPIALLMGALPDGTQAQLLTYFTSGDVTGEWDSSVSYVSLVFCRPAAAAAGEGVLTREEQRVLLGLARQTLETYGRSKQTPRIAEDDPRLTPTLRSPLGLFVTLKKHGELRGCIGHIIPRLPLYEGVIENAVNAGWRDHRFPPVSAAEVADLEIEISVLSVPEKVSSPDAIVIGKHGVILEKGPYSAVFLPQVAPEQGWGVEETLTHLSMKAGLPPDGWKEGAEFSVFTAQVFHE